MMLPAIDVEPFVPAHVGPNSIDVTLSPTLLVYREQFVGADGNHQWWLDCRQPTPTVEIPIPAEGYLITPGTMYLGSTVERTECHGVVPCIETRSSVARMGISSHLSAGFGDDGFCGHWTLEITCVRPVKIYAGMRIAQLTFTSLIGERQPYAGKYKNQADPTASLIHKDFQPEAKP